MVSARSNEFEAGFLRGGQTAEFTVLTKTIGVQGLIGIVNKMDDVTVNWD